MSAQETSGPAPSPLPWRIAGIRLTIFLKDDQAVPGETLFNEVFLLGAEKISSAKAQFLSTYEAPIENSVCRLSQMPGKLDFNVEETHADQQTFSQTTGVSEQLAARFLTSVKAQVEKLPGILRLGFGHSFFAPCEDQAAAYKAMGSCLPSVVVDPSSCDFYYRINRRRTLEFEGRPIVINRLSHWACLRKFSSVLDGNIITQKELGEAVSLTTDINTDHATILTDCSSASKSAIVGQLHSFSIEISVRGDIR